MGFDRLANFIIKNLNFSNGFVIDEMKRKLLGNHILFDLNFIIYNQMFSLEEEINTIIKIVLNLPFSYSTNNKTEDKLQEIFELPWWKKNCENIEFIFDGNNEDELINKLIGFINTKHDKNLTKLDLMVIDKVIMTTTKLIENFHITKNIQTIAFFIDGIPSFSKILEQRRRRCKNYFESMSRKQKFNDYFGNIKNFYMEEDGIKYNYFKWVEKRFSFDKSFSPISPIIKKLETDLHNFYTKNLPKIKIVVNQGSINGESDIKIFQFIQKENLMGDVLIHTTDSDLIHLMLVQQTYFNLKRKDVNISILKHNSKDDDTIQYFDGPAMINCLIKYYNDISGVQVNDFRIIYDFCLLLYFFGNDHLPCSYEIGPELGIDYMFKVYSRLKEPIIKLIDDKIELDFNIFKKYLQEFEKTKKNNFSKIIINRHFKLSPNITNFLTDSDKLNLDYFEILEFIKVILIQDGTKIKDKLDKNDIRYILMEQNPNFDYNKYIFKFKESLRNQIPLYTDQILDYLDFSAIENLGLVSYTKPFIRTNDNYQDLYNILSENTVSELYTKNKVLYEPLKDDYLELLKTEYNLEMAYAYIKKIFHLSTSCFGNLLNYHTNNITAYSYDSLPKVEFLIKYLNENNDINKMKKEIVEENLNDTDYFNSINHHIFITAYLSIDDIKDPNIKQTAQLLNVDNLWIGNKDVNNFYHNKVPALDFLNSWDTASKESEVPNILNASHTSITSEYVV
jgi:hypothetical protein